MNKLIQQLEEIAERKVENDQIRKEISMLVRMLNIGFEAKPVNMEKVSKVLSSNDESKIKKFYDQIASQINGLQVTGNFDLFSQYLKTYHGIDISFSNDKVAIQYQTNPKKFVKFTDLYNVYFLEEKPFEPSEALKSIMSAITNLTSEFTNVKEEINGILNDLALAETTESAVIKTMDKIISDSKLKAVDVEVSTSKVEEKIQTQQTAINKIEKFMKEGE